MFDCPASHVFNCKNVFCVNRSKLRILESKINFSSRIYICCQPNPLLLPLLSSFRTVEPTVPSFKRARSNTDSPSRLWSVPTRPLTPGARPTGLISTIWSSVTSSTESCNSTPMKLASSLLHQGWMRWTNERGSQCLLYIAREYMHVNMNYDLQNIP